MASGTGHKVPNETGNALSSNRQAEIDEKDWEILRDGHVQQGVYSGCGVTAKSPTPDMSVDVASGVIIYEGTATSITGQNVAVVAAEGNPRFDLVVGVSGSAVPVVIKGTAAVDPVFPAYAANRVVLAAIYVPASDTDIDADQIVDKRVFLRSLNLSGTFGTRPAAAIAGRMYFATDSQRLYYDTGTVWEYVGPTDFFDAFARADGALGTSDSGHAWVTDGLTISGGAVIPVSGAKQARVNLGHPITHAKYKGTMFAGTGSLDSAIILKWLDANNYLYTQLYEPDSVVRTMRVVAGVHNLITETPCVINDNALLFLEVEISGGDIHTTVHDGTTIRSYSPYGDKDDLYDPFTAATTVGLRVVSATATVRDFVVHAER